MRQTIPAERAFLLDWAGLASERKLVRTSRTNPTFIIARQSIDYTSPWYHPLNIHDHMCRKFKTRSLGIICS